MNSDRCPVPTPEEFELMRISSALQSGVQLALNELKSDVSQLDELFYEVDSGGCMVDVYIKLFDGRTAIGTAFAPKRRQWVSSDA